MDLSYILNHLGEERENYRGAVSPPIYQSSIFAFPTVAAFRDETGAQWTAEGAPETGQSARDGETASRRPATD